MKEVPLIKNKFSFNSVLSELQNISITTKDIKTYKSKIDSKNSIEMFFLLKITLRLYKENKIKKIVVTKLFEDLIYRSYWKNKSIVEFKPLQEKIEETKLFEEEYFQTFLYHTYKKESNYGIKPSLDYKIFMISYFNDENIYFKFEKTELKHIIYQISRLNEWNISFLKPETKNQFKIETRNQYISFLNKRTNILKLKEDIIFCEYVSKKIKDIFNIFNLKY